MSSSSETSTSSNVTDYATFARIRTWFNDADHRETAYLNHRNPVIRTGLAVIGQVIQVITTLRKIIDDLGASLNDILFILVRNGLIDRSYPDYDEVQMYLQRNPTAPPQPPTTSSTAPVPTPTTYASVVSGSSGSERIVVPRTPPRRRPAAGSRLNPIIIDDPPIHLASPRRTPRRRATPNPPRPTRPPPLPPHRAQCYACRIVGHWAKDCIHFRCHFCGEWKPGHYPMHCPNRRTFGSAAHDDPPPHYVDDDPHYDDLGDDARNNIDGEPGYGNY